MRPLFSARDYRRPTDRTEYLLNWCYKCEFGRLDGDFTPNAVQDFYNVAYYTHVPVKVIPNTGTSDERSFWERLRCNLAWRTDYGVPFEAAELGDPNGRTVCDIGCGNGDNLHVLSNAGFQVTGVEPDENARFLAKSFAEVFDGTAEQLPPQVQGKRFDIIIMSHVIEHCIDPHQACKNVCSILKPGGRVVIEVPNNASKGFAGFRGKWPWSDIPRHINFFTERSLRALLRAHDLNIASVNYVGYYRQFTRHWTNTQSEIWAVIGNGSRLNFNLAAWLLLGQTAFSQPCRKYDSIRVHSFKSSGIPEFGNFRS